MKFKWTFPYLLFGASTLANIGLFAQRPDNTIFKTNNDLSTANADTALLAYASSVTYDVDTEYAFNSLFLDAKAEDLCYNYTNNVTQSQSRIKGKRGTRGYRASVRQELPGAPVGKHCLYGQYVNLDRALDAANDTLTIIPKSAKASCKMFKSEMRKKYSGTEYAGCIYEGRMYETDSVYHDALNKHIEKRKVQLGDKFVLSNVMNEFTKSNYMADELEPGAILIVPRKRGSRSQFHAVVLLGRGYVEKGKFVQDENGRYIYAGLNRENIGDLFKAYDMSFVFAANIEKIARVEYSKEFARIENMTNSQLIEYVAGGRYNTEMLRKFSRPALLRLARDKYFKINDGEIKDNVSPSREKIRINPSRAPHQLLAMNAIQKNR